VADSEARRPSGPPGRAVSLRDSLVAVLALTAGAVNAVTFVRLGRVFSSVITGNLALLGVAAGQRAGNLAENGSLALAGFAFGVLAGTLVARTARSDRRIWPRRATVTLAAELLVLIGFSAGWLVTDGHPAGAAQLALLAVVATALGMQSAAVRHLGLMSSTYLTSTLTGILEVVPVGRLPASWQRSVSALCALVVGAALGGVTATASPALVPVVVLIPLAAVVWCAARSASLREPRERRRWRAPGRPGHAAAARRRPRRRRPRGTGDCCTATAVGERRRLLLTDRAPEAIRP
jgi:uncharacterized membrane protein YoaK (UPF0700 family)